MNGLRLRPRLAARISRSRLRGGIGLVKVEEKHGRVCCLLRPPFPNSLVSEGTYQRVELRRNRAKKDEHQPAPSACVCFRRSCKERRVLSEPEAG